MSFEITNISYDATRKAGITQTFKAQDKDNDNQMKRFLCQFHTILDLN